MQGMPLTALLDDVGELDATRDDLGSDCAWEKVHKARPRPALACTGCGGLVHAKVSPAPRRLRYFAHDAVSSACPLNGETMAHRLLKTEIAAAIRGAGWVAQLEAPGDRWRADVLAISPDGTRRFAWEAQLASITTDEIRERTSTMTGDGLEVCWVTAADAPWLGNVPSVRVEPATNAGAGMLVVDRVLRFEPSWCPDRRRCDVSAEHGYYLADAGPCSGHGQWRVPAGLTLIRFVAAVCADTSRPHTLRVHRWRHTRNAIAQGPLAWTAARYVHLENVQLDAEANRQHWQDARDAQRLDHENAVAALLARQDALVRPTVELVYHQAGVYPRIDTSPRDPLWAMGVPVFVHDVPYAVIAPVASRIAPIRQRLAGLLLIVATEAERARVARASASDQRIAVIPVDVPAVPLLDPQRGITVQEATSRMMGGAF